MKISGISAAAIFATALAVASCGSPTSNSSVNPTSREAAAETTSTTAYQPYFYLLSSPPAAGDLTKYAQDSGAKDFTLAFVGQTADWAKKPVCEAGWLIKSDSVLPINDPAVTALPAEAASFGGSVAISFGGGAGTYLENICPDVASLTREYLKVAQAFPTVTEWNFDIEAYIDQEPGRVNRIAALRNVVAQYPNLKFTVTLPVTETGLTSYPCPNTNGCGGIGIVKDFVNAGLSVKGVDIMTQGFAPAPTSMYTATVNAAKATHKQLAGVWPSKSSAEIWSLLGITPQIGDQWNEDPRFTVADARNLRQFAVDNGVGRLMPWRINQDFGKTGQCEWNSFSSYYQASCNDQGDQTAPFQFSHAFLGQ